MIYKNSNFIRRFLANIIDLFLTISLILLIFYLVSRNSSKPNNISFYSGFIYSIVIINLFYLFVPFLSEGRTIGLWLCKLKIIDSESKTFKIKTLLHRNVFASFYFTLIFIAIMAFYSENSFIATQVNQKEVISLKNDLYHKVVTQFIVTFLAIGFFIHTIGYLFIIFKAKKLSIVDFLTNSRIVENKPYSTQNKEKQFTPIYFEKRKFFYVDEK
ncbi:RDD family protein [Mycoplasmopsis edwardii]|nr:RDD family protein [Mycoplasmopsis edwardii]